MIPLRDAFALRFPAGNDWAGRALARLGLAEHELVTDVAQGWIRLGGDEGPLVDTLFVLTDERLGFGQTQLETAEPSWISLGEITVIDALEGLPYPLTAIEIQLANGLAMLVGWPDVFCSRVVETLEAQAQPQGTSAAEPPGADVFAPAPASPGMAPLFAAVDPEEDRRLDAFFETGSHEAIASASPAPPNEPLDTTAEVAGPWSNPLIAWPEPFRSVTYLGGHAEHPRRRKNVTLVLSAKGLSAVSPGYNAWKLHLGWHEIAGVEIQGADELKFTHDHSIGHNAAALVVRDRVSGTLVFELRGTRAAVLRSSLAPILNLVAS